MGEDVNVSCEEDKEEEDLRLARDAHTGLGGDDLDEDCEDCSIVREVANDSEDVHDVTLPDEDSC